MESLSLAYYETIDYTLYQGIGVASIMVGEDCITEANPFPQPPALRTNATAAQRRNDRMARELFNSNPERFAVVRVLQPYSTTNIKWNSLKEDGACIPANN